MIIDGKKYSWTQPVCTDCWVQEHSVRNPSGDDMFIRIPTRASVDLPWEEQLTLCCKCGRTTTSRIFIRVDPSAVPHPTSEGEE